MTDDEKIREITNEFLQKLNQIRSIYDYSISVNINPNVKSIPIVTGTIEDHIPRNERKLGLKSFRTLDGVSYSYLGKITNTVK